MKNLALIVALNIVCFSFALFLPVVPYYASLFSVILFVLLSYFFRVMSLTVSVIFGSLFIIFPYLISLVALSQDNPMTESIKLASLSFLESGVFLFESIHILLAVILCIVIKNTWPARLPSSQ